MKDDNVHWINSLWGLACTAIFTILFSGWVLSRVIETWPTAPSFEVLFAHIALLIGVLAVIAGVIKLIDAVMPQRWLNVMITSLSFTTAALVAITAHMKLIHPSPSPQEDAAHLEDTAMPGERDHIESIEECEAPLAWAVFDSVPLEGCYLQNDEYPDFEVD